MDELGPFMRGLADRLATLAVEELRERVLAYAARLPEARRTPFAHAFTASRALPTSGIDGLIAAAEALLADLEAGVYERGWDTDGSFHEQPIWEDTSWAVPLRTIADAATAAFLAGDDAASFALYAALVRVLDAQDDYGALFQPDDLELVDIVRHELVARYLRAAVGTPGSLEERATRLVEAIEHIGERDAAAVGLVGATEARMDVPPDIDALAGAALGHLVSRLRVNAGQSPWAQITVEAALMAGGADRLGEIIRTSPETHDQLAAEWVDALRLEGRSADAVEAARSAITLTTDDRLRARLHDRLVGLLADAGDDDGALTTACLALDLEPTVRRLSVAVDFAQASCDPDGAFSQIADIFSDQARSRTPLGGLTLALAGRLEAAIDAAAVKFGVAAHEATSWLIVAAVVRVAIGDATSARADALMVLQERWPHRDDLAEPTGQRLAAIARERLTIVAAALPRERVIGALTRVGGLVEARVGAILEAKRRGFYREAAEVADMYAEAVAVATDRTNGTAFLDAMKARYPRHTSFQRELVDVRRRGSRI